MVVSTGLPSPFVYKYSYSPNVNSLASYRAEIGLFYNRCQKYGCTHQVRLSFCFGLFFIWKNIKRFSSSYGKLLICYSSNIHHILLAYTVLSLLLLMSGDIETNPGPIFSHCISIIHSNIRSIRHKMNYIKDNLLDFDILCFTETHLDASIEDNLLALSDDYSLPYRKDRTNHGGGILVYHHKHLLTQRTPDLEIFWHESIWIKIKQNTDNVLIGVFL